MVAPTAAEAWLGRAETLWSALLRTCTEPAGGGELLLRSNPDGPVATLWPYTQVLHAAVLVGALRGDRTARGWGSGLERFRRGRAYQPSRGVRPGWRFYDDNAWVGLAAAQACQLAAGRTGPEELARRVEHWVAGGEDPRGGVFWRERLAGRHACSTGSAGLLALRVAPHDPAAVAFARRCSDFLNGPLRRPDGLVADSVRADGSVDTAVYSYNQGLSVGLDVLLHETGDRLALDRARTSAAATLEWFGTDDRLWLHEPCFNAILCRLLLLLHAHDGDPAWPAAVDGYLERVWAEGLRADGLVGAGGIGHYGTETALDQAGLVQLACLRGLEPAVLRLVC